MRPQDEHLLEYLRVSAEMMERAREKQMHVIGGLPEFVRNEGKLFTPAIVPEGVAMGKMKECYRNALLLATDNPDLVYVEGYALHIIPVVHAWCVTPDGTVIDPTWRDPMACAYYGIPIRTDWAWKKTTKRGYYGLLEAPEIVAQMATMKRKTYLDKRVA